MNRYLFELGVEEFPAREIEPTKSQLEAGFSKLLEENEIEYEDIEVKSTPRRFAVLISGLNKKVQEQSERVKGPSKVIAYDETGEPTKALLGFLRGQGKELDDVIIEEVEGTPYVFVDKTKEIKELDELLKEEVPNIIRSISFTRTMHWGGNDFKFARPIRWILSLYNDQVLGFDFEGLQASNITRGHRSLGSNSIEINLIDSYEERLKENGVILDQEERMILILQGANRLVREKGGTLFGDDELLEEVVNLVEYPTPFIGRIKSEYLNLPPEIIVTAMKDHQRYFPVLDDKDDLMPFFVSVRNGDSNGMENVIKGNEKVITPRLEDAVFFYREDLSKSLEEHREFLKTAQFHENLGTIYDKTERLEKLVELIGEKLAIGEGTIKNTKRAAVLSKADLSTNIVVEFTELQGLMGKIYAKESGESDIVAEAIGEQYLPRFNGDKIPKSTPGMVLSIADKIDTVVGMFAAGVRVTGSQDPYGLRRAALGIINILIHSNLDLNLKEMVSDSLYIYLKDQGIVFDYDEIMEEIMAFFIQRLRVKLLDEGHEYDLVDACFAVEDSNIYYMVKRVKEVGAWLNNQDDELLQSLIRVENIVSGYEYRDIEEDLIAEEAEKNLYNELDVLRKVNKEIDKKHYDQALEEFSNLIDPINTFMDQVKIMDDDERIKANRLAILNTIFDTIIRLFKPSVIVR